MFVLNGDVVIIFLKFKEVCFFSVFCVIIIEFIKDCVNCNVFDVESSILEFFFFLLRDDWMYIDVDVGLINLLVLNCKWVFWIEFFFKFENNVGLFVIEDFVLVCFFEVVWWLVVFICEFSVIGFKILFKEVFIDNGRVEVFVGWIRRGIIEFF